MSRCVSWGRLLLILGIATLTTIAQSQKMVHDDVYDRVVTIKGHVEISNPEGKMAASGQYLVFRRSGCKDCLIGTFADQNGDYKILVGQGRYELIVFNPSSVRYDMIAPEQPHFVVATPNLRDTEFNIKLRVK
jgi:hypothetical protein